MTTRWCLKITSRPEKIDWEKIARAKRGVLIWYARYLKLPTVSIQAQAGVLQFYRFHINLTGLMRLLAGYSSFCQNQSLGIVMT